MNQIARRHHTVPRFYLAGFANSANRLGVARLEIQKKFVQTIDNVSVNNNFYIIEDAEEGPDSFEKALSEIEKDASRVWNKILNDGVWPLEPDDREVLGTFIALQHVRGPNRRRHLSQLNWTINRLQIGAVGRAGLVDWFASEQGIDITESDADDIWATFSASSEPTIEASSILHINRIMDDVPETLRFFLARPWALIRFERKTLLTCDTPVSLVPRPDTPSYMGTGLLNAFAITLPLSRHVGLVMTDLKPLVENGVDPRRVVAGELDVVEPPTGRNAAMFNRCMLLNARNEIYYHPDDVGLLPDPLPEARNVEIGISGADEMFTALQQMRRR
ncbi:DUF4238 domain-containing protein [Nocardia xishanensis]|uniref:DUF4238 domain-containing protein n=1 Tax=Nocardia xishanensis TaxID=238964 RepID=UPI0034185175